MPSTFVQKKANILRSFQVSEQDYTDLSPKGFVDEDIRELCNEINALNGFVTTSSCAGRISVFLEGPSKVREEGDQVASLGGKGGGRWLYVSHSPVEMSALEEEGAVFDLVGIDTARSSSLPSPSAQPRFVRFKFEPMILHILTSSLENAQRALTAALSAGFRESGISSIAGDNPTPMVAVRTQGLALESIIASYDEATDGVCPMVTEGYLRTIIRRANERFDANTDRKKRFQTGLLQPHHGGASRVRLADGREWEPADVRAERKRAEGLRQKGEVRLRGAASQSRADDVLVFDTDVISSSGLFPD